MFRRFPLIFVFILCGCAYRFGLSPRALPGGYTQVAIPVFKNKSQETGIEMYFTNALIQRFARSHVAQVIGKDEAPVVLEGTIRRVITSPQVAETNSELPSLPADAVLTTQYRLEVKADLKLRRRSDDKIIWQGRFDNEEVYSAPQLGRPVVNSADATYNQSARQHTMELLAQEMMIEAHDRLTENF